MRPVLLAAAAAALAIAASAHAEPQATIGEAIRPSKISGVGLQTADLERSRAFYVDVLGLKVAARIPAQGPAFEYLLSLSGKIDGESLVVLTRGAPQPGAATFGRIILMAPDGRALAERVAAAGYAPEKIVAGTNLVRDPDGYMIELYQRPAPKAPN